MFSSFPWLRTAGRLAGILIAVLAARGQSEYATPFSMTIVAGASSIGSTDGPAALARFLEPQAITRDAAGNLYIADTGNDCIRKFGVDGRVSTLAGAPGYPGNQDGTGSAARFNAPTGVAVDAAGNVYVADTDNHAVRKITPHGVVTTLAGGAGIFDAPGGVAVDAIGQVFVADTLNHVIRLITPGGTVSTFAGTVGAMGSEDGFRTAARFSRPLGIAVDTSGNIYVADANNRAIRRIDPAGQVTTLAAFTGQSAPLLSPRHLAVDGLGNVHLTSDFSSAVFKVSASGVLQNPEAAGEPIRRRGDQSRFPQGVALDPAGHAYVADSFDNTIRKIAPDGTVTTLAGLSEADSLGDADGIGAAARFRPFSGVAADATGFVHVADRLNHTIRKVSPDGQVTTLAGLAGVSGQDDGVGTQARFNGPGGVAVDAHGNVYVADTLSRTIRRISPAGTVATVAGSPGVSGEIDGSGAAARFTAPSDLALDAAGNLYVCDDDVVRRVTPAGAVTTLVNTTGQYVPPEAPFGILKFETVEGVAVDAGDNLYVAYQTRYRLPHAVQQEGGSTIRRFAPDGTMTVVAGAQTAIGDRDGNGIEATFRQIRGLAVDQSRNLYVADTGNHLIRRISSAGVVATVAGLSAAPGCAEGVGPAARLHAPAAIALETTGTLYVASGATLFKGQTATQPVITREPQDVTVTAGGTAQFRVIAVGVPAPTYQWFHLGRPLAGATTDTLNLAGASAADAGEYRVVASNALGAVTSRSATLTINPAAPAPAASGGGGGGAASLWFLAALLALAGVRRRLRAGDEA